MANEAASVFFSKIHMLLLAGSCATVLMYLLMRKHGRIFFYSALGVVFIFTFLDLYLFAAYHTKRVLTQSVAGVDLGKSITPFRFPESRAARLAMHDSFIRHYRPALEERHSALDASYSYYFDTKANMRSSLASFADSVMSGNFPLVDEMRRGTMMGVIRMGRTAYDVWGERSRTAYISLCETALIGIEAELDFLLGGDDAAFRRCLTLPDAQPVVRINLALNEAHAAAKANASWNSRGDLVDAFDALFAVPPSPAALAMNPAFERSRAMYRKLYMSMPAEKALAVIWSRYLAPNVNTFVRLNDIDFLIRVFEESDIDPRLYKVRECLKSDMAIGRPLVRFFPNATVLSTDSYRRLLQDGSPDSRTVYIDAGSQDMPQTKKPHGSGLAAIEEQKMPDKISVLSYGPDSAGFLAESSSDGFLYYSDTYDRYWRAKIDGKDVPVYKANGAFKAVEMRAGRRKIDFVYDPVYYRWALKVYYITAIACVLFLGIVACRRHRHTGPGKGIHGLA